HEERGREQQHKRPQTDGDVAPLGVEHDQKCPEGAQDVQELRGQRMEEEDHGHDLVADSVHVPGIVQPRVAAGEDARPLLHVGAIVVARSFHEPHDDQHDPGNGEQPPHSAAIEAGREAHCGDSYHQRLGIAGKIYLTTAVCGRIVEGIEPVRTGGRTWPYRGRPGQTSAVEGATRPTPGPFVAKEGSMTGTLLTLVFLAVIIGAVVVIASSVARRRKRTDEAAILQSQLSDTIARESQFSGLHITPTARVSGWRSSQVTLEVAGEVPTPELRERVMRVVSAEAWK